MSDFHKKVLIVPTMINHTSCYVAMFRLLSEQGCEVGFAGQKSILDSINSQLRDIDGIDIFIRKDHEKSYALLRKIRKQLKAYDLIIFDEIYHSPLSLIRFLLFNRLKAKKILVIHNIHKWLSPRIKFKLRYLVSAVGRMFLVKRMAALIVMSPSLKKYVVEAGLYNKPVFVLPFMLPDNTEPHSAKPDDRFTFSVPGGIDPDRKDYDTVLDAFESLWDDGVDVRLKLVGSFGSESTTELVRLRCETLQQKFGKDKFIFWYDRVDTEAYSNELKASDVIVSNIRGVYSAKENIEVYGLTKESGLVFDLVRYCLPAFVSGHLPFSETMAASLIKYSDAAGLKELVLSLLDGRISYADLLKKAEVSSSTYERMLRVEGSKLLAYLNT